MVMGTHFNVLLYVHYLSCYNPVCSIVLIQTQYGLFTAKAGATCQSYTKISM